MKLIKAYVRNFMAEKVIEKLKEAGVPRITAIDIEKMGDEISNEEFKVSSELGSTYTEMVKLELICNENCVEKAVKIIKNNANTGTKGDGIIVISPVEKIYSIRTKEEDKKNF